MSTLSSAREIARAETSPFTFGRAMTLLAGAVAVGIDNVMTRTELARSRRQLAQLDERLLRDIGLDRGAARFEASKSFWS